MKKILITGANSYIGTSVEHYLKQWPERYAVETVDMIDGSWREKSFAGYDTVYHVAGIAHSDTGEINDERKALYDRINTQLTIETAEKAKADGAKQFIFMSSAIVYGDSAPIGKQKIITRDTVPQPANCYGDSKLQAEKGILPLQSDRFHVVVLRPPMIYGKGCKGNYQTLVKLATRLPIFPDVENCRSMLYIENLCAFVRLMIDNGEQGVFWPQNAEYTRTSDMVRMIAEAHGKRIRLTKAFNWLLPVAARCTGLVDKAFGSLCYEPGLSRYKSDYAAYGLSQSISRTETMKEAMKYDT